MCHILVSICQKGFRTNLIKIKIILLKPISDRRTSSNRHVLLLVNICGRHRRSRVADYPFKVDWHCASSLSQVQLYARVPREILGCELCTLVFCCYNCLDLPWEKFFQVWEFVTFSRHYSCLRELGKQVANTWKKLWAWYKSRQL